MPRSAAWPSQDRVATFELPTDGYTQVNAMVTFKPIADSPCACSSTAAT
jgi:hypothetical protein